MRQSEESMNKNQKRNLRIGCVVLVLLALLHLWQLHSGRQAEEKAGAEQAQKEKSAAVLSLTPEEIASICFTGTDGMITLEQKDGAFVCPEDDLFVMREEAASRMRSDLCKLTCTRVLEDVSEEKRGAFGLDPALSRIIITLTDGKTIDLSVGDRNDQTKELYFALDRDPETVYLTKTALDRDFSGRLSDYYAYNEFPEIIPSKIRRIIVEKDGGFTLDTPGDDTCTVTGEDGSRQPAGLGITGEVESGLGSISWLKNLEYNCRDLASYGLEDPAASITVQTEDGEEISFVVGGTDEKGNYYVMLSGSREVHSVRREYLDKLVDNGPEAFWSLTYSFVSIGDLDELNVLYKDEEHTLKRDSVQDEEIQDSSREENGGFIWLVDDRKVEKDLFTKFYYNCVSVTAQERLTEVPDIQEEPVLTLDYTMLDGSGKDIRYYPWDQDFFLVIYEGGTKAALINKMYVNAILSSLDSLLSAK